jgi:hypothetical protein
MVLVVLRKDKHPYTHCSRFVDRNLPDDVPLEGKTYRGTLLNQYDLNLCPDGISVM